MFDYTSDEDMIPPNHYDPPELNDLPLEPGFDPLANPFLSQVVDDTILLERTSQW